MKNQKGITLIALIITIVVILILSAVSINMVIGENGLINKTTSATEAYAKAQIKEKVEIAVMTTYVKNNGKMPSLKESINQISHETIP